MYASTFYYQSYYIPVYGSVTIDLFQVEQTDAAA